MQLSNIYALIFVLYYSKLLYHLVILYIEFIMTFAGGNGYINDYPAGRLLRDAKLYEIGAGTSEVRRLVIARAINAHYK